ncbi:MAG: SWIM zinc finger family protein [Xanthomonadaceae bacterium]|nr:SWIM zinc finger family protein [Xanthomonadaceae bacterium]
MSTNSRPETNTDMPDAARRTALQAWLRQLDDDVLVGWANRGLLRRARGVLASVEDAGWSASGLACSIESQTVVLIGPGFPQLRCSCPAGGPCHHALAALLRWCSLPLDATGADVGMGVDATAPSPAEAAPSTLQTDTAFWNAAAWTPIARALRAATLRRARGWLEDGLQIDFVETPAQLEARLHDHDRTRVRFDAALGPANAICTCAQPACAHAAAALYAWREQHALDRGDARPQRPHRETVVLDAVESTLCAIADEGLSQLSATRLDALEALSQRCRQADLPALARDLVDLHRAATAELARRHHAEVAAVARCIARAWARLRALRAPVSPQPRMQLKGRHRRDYHPAPTLDLDVCAIERWDANGVNGSGIGFTLHAWCHAGSRWWRMPVADHVGAGSAVPDWRQHRWAARTLGDLLGQRLRLDGAWASDDGSLSARADTRWSTRDAASETTTTEDAVATQRPPADAQLDIATAIDGWRRERPPGLLDARPRIALVTGLHLLPQGASKDALTLSARDADGRWLVLHWPDHGDSRLRARHRLDALLARDRGPHQMLGWLQCIDGTAHLEPISLWSMTTQRWWHLHTDDVPGDSLPAPPTASDDLHRAELPHAELPHADLPRADRLGTYPILQALLGTQTLACRQLAHGCAHADPGITLARARWRTEGLGRDWPELLQGVGEHDATCAPHAHALLDALVRIALALQLHDPRGEAPGEAR